MSWSGLRSRWRCCVVGAACWWGVAGVAGEGDSPVFIESMHDFFAQHGGTGPGQVLYEILFDVDNADYDGDFLLYGATKMPESAAAYQRRWAD